jgi:hypothetical protein
VVAALASLAVEAVDDQGATNRTVANGAADSLRREARHAASGQARLGSLNLVDLAGSERLDKSGAEGARR